MFLSTSIHTHHPVSTVLLQASQVTSPSTIRADRPEYHRGLQAMRTLRLLLISVIKCVSFRPWMVHGLPTSGSGLGTYW